jgi:hypothetical protein
MTNYLPRQSVHFIHWSQRRPAEIGKLLRCIFLLIALGIIASSLPAASAGAQTINGATLTAGPIAYPAGFMTSVKSYGAVGDGKTDDSNAIQRALSDGRSSATADYNGLPKALYFPPGVYLVSKTLTWNGCCVTLQGDGSSASVIRLAPGSPGFGDASAPKSVLMTPSPSTNRSFRQNIWDLGIKVGSGNPGAAALTYSSNNVGSVHNVSIISEDGQGVIGLDLTHRYPGPLMIKNVLIQGFQRGIDTCNAYEYSATIEGLTLKNQTVAGIHDQRETLNIRNLKSTNRVPALVNDGASVVLIDAVLSGGISSQNAIVNNSALYLRNVSSSGYAATLSDTSSTTPKTLPGLISEFTAQQPVKLSSSGSSSLKLTVQETPVATISTTTEWSAVAPRWYGDTGGLQTTFDSGKPNVYFPSSRYLAYNQASIIVPDAVRDVVGFGSVVNGDSAGTNGGGIQLVINSNSPEPLIIEQFGYGIKIVHRGSRPVVLKDGQYSYVSYAGAGDLFLEDVNLPQVTFQSSQHVWARQLNEEFSGTKITNNGSLWIMGLKTELAGTVIKTNSNAKTELLGALIYPAATVPSTTAAFASTNASVSYVYAESVYCTSCGYSVQIQEVQNGAARTVQTQPKGRYVMPLFIGIH